MGDKDKLQWFLSSSYGSIFRRRLFFSSSIYSCYLHIPVFPIFWTRRFLTGLHFFHLLLGVLLFCLLFWTCSLSSEMFSFINLRVSEIHLFYNLLLFYWHFLEILWLYIFLLFYKS